MPKIVQLIINVIIGAILTGILSLFLITLITIVVSLFHPVGFSTLGALSSIGFVAMIIGFILGGIVTAYTQREKSRKEKPKMERVINE